MLIDKKNQDMFIIDVTIPAEFRATDEEAENISKYKNLALKIILYVKYKKLE